MTPGPFQLLLIAVVAILLFGGRGRISSIMGDMAKGIRSFRTGLNDTDKTEEEDEKIVNVTPKDKVK